jgi:SAM-dependent methyltransferase
MNKFYDPDGFAHILSVEDRHFWFVERNRLICWAVRKYLPSVWSFCEVGCGMSVVLRAMERGFHDLNLIGIDCFPEALALARQRLNRTVLLSEDILNLPLASVVDAIGAFDVLEHIPDDRAALAGLYRAIKPGGGLLLTVPQHRFLWSVSDEIGHHQRRYDRADLIRKVEAEGFRILRITSFVSILLPLLWANRRRALSKEDALLELQIGRKLNTLCGATLNLERGLIRSGLSLPMEGSLLLVALRA